jgi:ABC-type antimicrobial peptide transport system permease subunit
MEPLLLLFAGTVLVLAAGTLVHALAVALRRRRREVALLKALGFDRSAIGRTVLLQAVSLAALGVVVGVPLGLVLGRWAWRLAARTVGVLSGPVTPVTVPMTVVVVLLAAAAAGVGPARRARQVAAADVLRSE